VVLAPLGVLICTLTGDGIQAGSVAVRSTARQNLGTVANLALVSPYPPVRL
jgi:hypothetical protein